MIPEDLKEEHHANIVWIAGRPYLLLPTELRVRMIKRKRGEYPYYYVPIPAPLARAFHRAHGIEDPREADGLPLTILVTKAPWYHGVDMTGITEGLSGRAKKEISALRLDTPPRDRPELVAILADKEQIEQLGLDPEKPITLDDIVEAVRRRLLEELQARGDGRKEGRVASARRSPART